MKQQQQFLLLTLVSLGVLIGSVASGQQYPLIPKVIPFAGINIHLDNFARRIIATDVKVLMVNKSFWDDKLNKASMYFPLIEASLMDEDVPIDFKYLAAQESGLVPNAISSSDAVGFWQFKDATAQELGLRVDNQVDERKNISSSSHAAAQYLKRSNKSMNNWAAALLSYYYGIGGLKEKIPRDWNNANEINLTGKTDRYLLRFLAHKIAFEASLEHFESTNTVELNNIPVVHGADVRSLGKQYSIKPEEIRAYNQWFVGDKVPSDKTYLLVLPIDKRQMELANNVAANAKYQNIGQSEETLTASTATMPELAPQEPQGPGYPILKKSAVQGTGRRSAEFYEINGLPGVLCRPSDTPKSLAKAGHVSLRKFKKYNDLTTRVHIIPGEVYYLAEKNEKGPVEFHTVEPGETLHGISHMYGVQLLSLLRYNRIRDKDFPLENGRVLWLQKRRPSREPVEIKDIPTINSDSLRQPVIAQNQEMAPKEETAAASAPDKAPSDISSKDRVKYTPQLEEDEEPANEELQPASNEQEQLPDATQPIVETDSSQNNIPLASPNVDETLNTKDSALIVNQPDSATADIALSEKDSVDDGNVELYAPSKSSKESDDTTDREIVISATDEATKDSLPDGWENDSETIASDDAKPEYSPEPSTNTEKIVKSNPATSVRSTHIVQKGNTFYSISKLYNMPVSELLSLNDLTANDKLSIGQELKIKRNEAVETSPPDSGSVQKSPSKHLVKKGDTMFNISKRYGVTIAALQEANNMADDNLSIGQQLTIPAP